MRGLGRGGVMVLEEQRLYDWKGSILGSWCSALEALGIVGRGARNERN
jgi:hypothetical protein